MSNEIIKCNCCGGTEIEIKPHSRIGRCKSCGASVILPDLEDHEILHLLDEAYIERSNFEFDKAASIYEYILTKNPNEICAFEGLILCKYGIIYVKDPQTGESIPTCHRYSPISIFDDQDFVNYFTICPTEEEKNVFRKMGDDIEHLQKEISKQLKNEKDYDIFISFKSKDKDGKSTEDALIARDLYDQFVAEGYEVFMSDVSLKDRINAEYEPIIYNALQTSEVFILVGTSKENVYSPWVRNEWSRFINIINTSGGRLNPSFFIPVYKNMSPYEMPRINNRNVQCVDASDLLYKKNISDYIKHLISPTYSHEKDLTKEELARIKIQEEAKIKAEERAQIRKEKLQEKMEKRQREEERRKKEEIKRSSPKHKKRVKTLRTLIIVFLCLAVADGLITWAVISSNKKDKAKYTDLLPTPTEILPTDQKLDVSKEYGFKYDYSTFYYAKCVSDSLLKVERWTRENRETTKYNWKNDVNTFSILDENLKFSWIDDNKTSFRINLMDKDVSGLGNEGKEVVFTINITNGDDNKGSNFNESIVHYDYSKDKNNIYIATPLSSSLIKIEKWKHVEKTEWIFIKTDVFGYEHDVRIINVDAKDADFVWNNEQKSSFTINMYDPFDSWDKGDSKYTTFTIANPEASCSSSLEFLGK